MTTPLIENIGLLAFGNFVGFVLGSIVVYSIMRDRPDDERTVLSRVKDQLGLRGVPSAFVVFGLIFWFLIFGILFFGLITTIWDVIYGLQKIASGEQANWRFLWAKVASLVAVSGAVIAFPLTLIKIELTRKQARHNELVLQNERIQGALSLMSAQTTEKRIGRTVKYRFDGQTGAEQQWYDEDHSISDTWTDPEIPDWRTVEASKPDLQQRLAGIRQLAAVVEEDDSRDSRSTDTSQEHSKPSLRRIVNEHLANYIRTNAGRPNAETVRILRLDWETADQNAIKNALPDGFDGKPLLPRADIQAALSVIASSTKNHHTHDLDLRGTDLRNTDLQSAYLAGVWLEAAQLSNALMKMAILDGARLHGAELGGTKMQDCSLRNAVFKGSFVVGTRLQGAAFHNCDFTCSTWVETRAQTAAFEYCNFANAGVGAIKLNGALFIGELSSGVLSGVPVGRLKGAAIREADLSLQKMSQEQTDAIYYDGSVTLSASVERRAGSDEILSISEFKTRWRAWQKEIGFDPDNPGD